MTPLSRRATTGFAALTLIAGGAALGVAAPAHAAPVDVDGVTFYWDLNDESTSGAFFGYNLMSAGKIGDPGEGGQTLTASQGATWSNGEAAGWAAQEGDVTVQDLQADGTWATTTFDGTRKNSAGATSTTTGITGETRFAFREGTGTLDPDADSASIAWTGDATVLFYSGYTYFTFSDPTLTVSGGEGELTATVGGYRTSQDDPSVWEQLPDAEVSLATLGGVDVTADGLVVTPDYAGVEYDSTTGSPQSRTSPGWGSFPTDFVDYMADLGMGSYWYTSGLATTDGRKPANELTVTRSAAPALAAATVKVTAGATAYGKAATATVAVASTGARTGQVTLRRAGKVVGTKTLAGGRATFSLGRQPAGTHRLTATFAGNAETAGATGAGTLKVTRATTRTTAKVTARPTRKKAGKVAVTVSSPTAAVTGRATVVVKRGAKKVRTVRATLRAGAATVALPKGAAGAYTVVVTYAGGANVAGSTRRATYRIR